jgi:hypothetical protein
MRLRHDTAQMGNYSIHTLRLSITSTQDRAPLATCNQDAVLTGLPVILHGTEGQDPPVVRRHCNQTTTDYGLHSEPRH